MRLVWLLALGACGDNDRPARLDVVAKLPPASREVVFDGEGTAVVRLADGTARRLAGGRFRPIAMAGARAIDLGTDRDGGVLVMSSEPRRLFRLAGDALEVVGGTVLANYVYMPVQVPSGNHYVREIDGARRSFVLSPGTTTWAETPTMFPSRPVRAFDGTLYGAVAAGVQRFDAGGTRTLVHACTAPPCTDLVVGGLHDGDVVAGDPQEPAIFVGGDHIGLPGDVVPVQIAAGAELTVVLAKRDARNPDEQPHVVYALRAGARTVEPIEVIADPPSPSTRLAVDGAGAVYVATTSLAKVLP